MDTEHYIGLLCVAMLLVYPMAWFLCIAAAEADKLRDEARKDEERARAISLKYWESPESYDEKYQG